MTIGKRPYGDDLKHAGLHVVEQMAVKGPVADMFCRDVDRKFFSRFDQRLNIQPSTQCVEDLTVSIFNCANCQIPFCRERAFQAFLYVLKLSIKD